ncbi:hypothetical protein EYF80_050168 [Liparis tanakae]|uniref:Uncharacterized protein n=1 Tax=Liparis tanakae TaxID=230148 RepID=A0A4Z2FFJ5_9TELE|nr:hypothetical protein EYF80_050168 [Liparis tanakae]
MSVFHVDVTLALSDSSLLNPALLAVGHIFRFASFVLPGENVHHSQPLVSVHPVAWTRPDHFCLIDRSSRRTPGGGGLSVRPPSGRIRTPVEN